MEALDTEPPSEAALGDRLARLAERRRATERRHRSCSPTADSSEDAEACMPARHGAIAALRELLEGRGTALEGGMHPSGSDWDYLQPAQGGGEGRPDVQAAALDEASQQTCTSALSAAVVPSEAIGSSSMPPTARLLISLDVGIGREAAAGDKQQRSAELRHADATVREAEAQCAELDALLLRQQAAEAQRERQRAERHVELSLMQLAFARQHMAAWRIGRAWARFLASPGRRREVAAVTRIQTLWRGWAARRRTAIELQRHRQRCAQLQELHILVEAGELAQARQAAEQLVALGGSPRASQLVQGLERRAAEAERTLRGAAASGGAEAYQAATQAALRFSHLLTARREAANQFGARVAAAEEAVTRAVQDGPLLQFKEAVAAAAALGVAAPFLSRAERLVAARNQEAAAALQAALEASPFEGQAFQAGLEQAQRCGLHADAARAQRGLQLRRHRTAGSLQQLAAEGGAHAVEAACREAWQLGLEAEAEAALGRLEQRQATSMEELRQAAHRGSLAQYQQADVVAEALHISPSVRHTCSEQVQVRQQEAEQRLRLAAAGQGDLAAVLRLCRAASLLGLPEAVGAAEQEVLRRREQAVEQLTLSTRAACEFASRAAHAEVEPRDAVGAGASSRALQAAGASQQQLLGGWLAGVRQLAGAIADRGPVEAMLHPPATCGAWPLEMRGWLVDAHAAAGLELGAHLLAAVQAFQTHLQALHAAAQVVVVRLQPSAPSTSRSASGSVSSICAASASISGRLSTSHSRLSTVASSSSSSSSGDVLCLSQGQQETLRRAPASAAAAQAEQLLARFREWRTVQQDVLLLVAGTARRMESGSEDNGEGDGIWEADAPAAGSLDLSCQGLTNLELLAGGSAVASLNLSTNALTSLDGLSALHALRELRVGCNQLGGLQGVQALCRLEVLNASRNRLASLPSLAGLALLRHLDLSSNELTPAALAAAGLRSGAGAQLTSLRLAGNPGLTGQLSSWLGPLPSLLRLDLSGCGLNSLEGLAEATPLLQVLAASGNRVACLPPSLSLPFLRELWLGGNLLAQLPCWPWLPSLQELHLQDNQLTSLAAMQGFPSLQSLDLSFNQLCSLATVLASLAPVSATLGQLRVNDNPWVAPGGGQQLQQQQQQQQPGAGMGATEAYSGAVFRVLPLLRELDSQAISEAEQGQHAEAAARQRMPQPADAARVHGGAQWEAQTVLWALVRPAAAEAVQQEDAQQRAMAVAALLHQAERPPLASLPVAGLAAALFSLHLAAAAGGRQQPAHTGTPAGRSSSSSNGNSSLHALRLAQQQYLLLAAADPSDAQSLVLLNPTHYHQALAAISGGVVRVQAAWRGYRARCLREYLAAQRRAQRELSAAAAIQAAWRGWLCRQRRQPWVQHRLVIWRDGWRDAQRRLMGHQQQCAAVRIQAAWRGARVRSLLARACRELEQRAQRQRGAGAPGGQHDGGEGSLDLELSGGSLIGLLEPVSSSVFAAPEVLQPRLAAGGVCAPTQPGSHDGGYDWARLAGMDGGGTAGTSPLAAAGAAQQQQQRLWQTLPADALLHSAGVSSGNLFLQSSPVQQPASPGTIAGGASGAWEFSDPATAAAYEQLPQRQLVAARRRELQQQMKDPAMRLQHFQGKGTLPLSPPPRGSLGTSGTVASKRRNGSGSSTSSGSSVRASEWTLPALPSSRLPNGAAAAPRSPCSSGASLVKGARASRTLSLRVLQL